jgi:serine/threonine protein kinase
MAQQQQPLQHELVASRFKIYEKVLGTGSSACVKLAFDVVTGQYLAAKIFERTETKEIIRARHEAILLSGLNHPNVIKYAGFFEDSEHSYIFMEYVSGSQSLQHLVDSRKLEEEEARLYIRQVLDGVQFLHENGIAHRDLKLDNVLIDRLAQRAVIIDFGLSARISPKPMTDWCGTPLYAAPELLLRQPYHGTNLDLYTLGVMIYRILTGAFPFDGPDAATVFGKIVNDEVDIPVGSISFEAANLVQALLHKTPSSRPSLRQVKSHAWLSLAEECEQPTKKRRKVECA